MEVEQKDLERNLRIFVWYRALFNARFYYPVFAVFFTDLGLSMAQFLWLNALWAITIVLLEVPSGVLADLLGRKKLVVFSAFSMVVEMLLLIVAPQNGGWWLFGICAANRVLSGLAEAAASGADEALAYDSLKKLGDTESGIEDRWDHTLVSAMRWRSLAGVLAMLLGGLVYDHERMVMLLGDFPHIISIKLPVILCFLSGCVCVVLALKLRDPEKPNHSHEVSVKGVATGMVSAGSWVIHTRWIAAIMIAAVLIDATTRTFVTLQSEYFRHINLPEYSFGIIGAAMSLAGWVVPLYVRPLSARFKPRMNMLIVAGLGVTGLSGIALLDGYGGIVASFLIMMTLMHTGFLMSRYINKDAPSEKRASILSVNSLAINLSYGVFSMVFAWRIDQVGFGDSLPSLPAALACVILIWFVASHHARKPTKKKNSEQ